MSQFNRQTLVLRLVDKVTGNPMTGPSMISIDNLQVSSAQGARLRIKLDTTPEKLEIPDLLAVPVGNTRISVTADGYGPKSEFLIIGSAAPTELTIALEPSESMQDLGGPPVQLSVDSLGNFSITPTTRVAKPGDTVTWQVPAGHLFAIHFNDPCTPFDKVVYCNSGSKPEIDVEVPVGAGAGVFEYAVALYDGKKVWIHVSGEVRVERPH